MQRLLFLIVIIGTLTAGSNARAQSDVIIKQRAKSIRDANNAQQGVPPPVATPTVTPTPVAAAAPQASTEQQQAVDKLTADLTAIKAGAAVTADQKQSLEKDFVTFAKGGAKPSKEEATKLAADLSAALSGKDVTERERGQLARSIQVIVNSGNITAAQAQTFVTVANTSLKSAGVGEEDIKTIGDDLKTIIADIQKNRTKQQ